ncbi:MAG: HAD family hydrolase [Eubacteriales bacterium]|nr:HAD family hydrolase [Eubacteriales bacterium]
MKLTAVLFDLDGTLLPMDQDEFTKGYFKLLAAKMSEYGYSPEQLVHAVWAGTSAMVKNNGSMSNEDVFWKKFAAECGERRLKDKSLFDMFYQNEFLQSKTLCGYNPEAAQCVAAIRGMGLRVALATNPIFPATATESRIRWAGLEPRDFELYTTYENIGFCKPNPEYYKEILRRMNVCPEECLMVGNDVTEDMVAAELGISVFLLTDCLINKEHRDISRFRRGGFQHLMNFVQELQKQAKNTK